MFYICSSLLIHMHLSVCSLNSSEEVSWIINFCLCFFRFCYRSSFLKFCTGTVYNQMQYVCICMKYIFDCFAKDTEMLYMRNTSVFICCQSIYYTKQSRRCPVNPNFFGSTFSGWEQWQQQWMFSLPWAHRAEWGQPGLVWSWAGPGVARLGLTQVSKGRGPFLAPGKVSVRSDSAGAQLEELPCRINVF